LHFNNRDDRSRYMEPNLVASVLAPNTDDGEGKAEIRRQQEWRPGALWKEDREV
jgi:hypothetical protein